MEDYEDINKTREKVIVTLAEENEALTEEVIRLRRELKNAEFVIKCFEFKSE